MPTDIVELPSGNLLATLDRSRQSFQVGESKYVVIDLKWIRGTTLARDYGNFMKYFPMDLLLRGERNKISITDDMGVGIEISRRD